MHKNNMNKLDRAHDEFDLKTNECDMCIAHINIGSVNGYNSLDLYCGCCELIIGSSLMAVWEHLRKLASCEDFYPLLTLCFYNPYFL